jgi:hypothetical protein
MPHHPFLDEEVDLIAGRFRIDRSVVIRIANLTMQVRSGQCHNCGTQYCHGWRRLEDGRGECAECWPAEWQLQLLGQNVGAQVALPDARIKP